MEAVERNPEPGLLSTATTGYNGGGASRPPKEAFDNDEDGTAASGEAPHRFTVR